jgi:hypothetical protein
LAEDFGARSDLAHAGIRALVEALAAGRHRARAAPGQRNSRIRPGLGRDGSGTAVGLDSLVSAYLGRGAECDPLELLLAVETYYVLVVKLLVWQTLAAARRQPNPAAAIRGAIGADRLLQCLGELESGCLGVNLGIAETASGARPHRARHVDHVPHPFAWYAQSWNERLDGFVRRMAEQWQGYDFRALTEGAVAGSDLLKSLYQEVFPKRFRHALGEYYTPDWLADLVIERVGYDGNPDWRVLDPACGSGTFLVMAINKARQYADEHMIPKHQLLPKILENVIGFDLNP